MWQRGPERRFPCGEWRPSTALFLEGILIRSARHLPSRWMRVWYTVAFDMPSSGSWLGRRDGLFLLLLLVLSGYLSYLQWCKMPGFWGDRARWMFEAYRVFQGDRPHRDLASSIRPSRSIHLRLSTSFSDRPSQQRKCWWTFFASRCLYRHPARPVFRLSWKWRERSAVKITERTHEKDTEALYSGRAGSHSEAAFAGEGANFQAL